MSLSCQAQWGGFSIPDLRLGGDCGLRPALGATWEELRGRALTREGHNGGARVGGRPDSGGFRPALSLPPPPGFGNDGTRLQFLTLDSTCSA